MDPWTAPAVLGEGVDAAPGGDDDAVEELLRAACTADPALADEEKEREHDTVADERAAHDEVSQTLSQVIVPTET